MALEGDIKCQKPTPEGNADNGLSLVELTAPGDKGFPQPQQVPADLMAGYHAMVGSAKSVKELPLDPGHHEGQHDRIYKAADGSNWRVTTAKGQNGGEDVLFIKHSDKQGAQTDTYMNGERIEVMKSVKKDDGTLSELDITFDGPAGHRYAAEEYLQTDDRRGNSISSEGYSFDPQGHATSYTLGRDVVWKKDDQ